MHLCVVYIKLQKKFLKISMRKAQGFSHTDAIIHFPHLVLSAALPPSREEAVTGCRLCYLLHYGIVSEFPLSFAIK